MIFTSMADAKHDEVERLVDSMAAKANLATRAKIDEQFEAKLALLESSKRLSEDTLDKLRVLWKLFRQPDSRLPWASQALVMVALSYFINPLDLIPDVAGKAGYADDALVVRIVYGRLGDHIDLAAR